MSKSLITKSSPRLISLSIPFSGYIGCGIGCSLRLTARLVTSPITRRWIPSAIALVIGLFGFIAAIKYRRELFKGNPYSILMLTACAFYVIALILQGYSTYKYTATPENMNGRYLLPILLLTAAVFVKAFSLAFRKYSHLKVIIACVIVVLFLEGGGILTYISRSDDSWYFQNSKVIKANEVAKKITKKVVISGRKTDQQTFGSLTNYGG